MTATIDRNAYSSSTRVALMAALLAEGGAPVAATFTAQGSALQCTLRGVGYSLTPSALVRQPQPTAPEKTANAYSVLYGSKLGAVDALVMADDGRVFESIAAYEADGSSCMTARPTSASFSTRSASEQSTSASLTWLDSA